ncbi:hypothetical protein F5J12DRAFT_718347 [Pisolithus orientalis]|uniref:uncharacterized protein n=1 Tax=Pisolithus orientalis TaxID=936130 RepID=UPI0022240A19|nr:uncharacterized protein F5J12DRAFT_718347 [Pisolithus orientalis]KAI6012716.1 hypothetical protein F5J12DRAFT_718347 [Pisolithus orientalis]
MSSVAGSETIINDFIAAIHPNFDYVLTDTAFSACLFTLLIVLFAFSTKESRRRLVFRLNVLAICVALALGIFSSLVSGRAIIDPFNQVSKGVYIASIVFAVFPPVLYDSILLTRLFALYPISNTPRTTLFKIFAFPFCVKCARVIVLVCFFFYFEFYFPVTLCAEEAAAWFRNPFMVSEWTMQIADNLYSVSFFLYNLHARTSLVKRVAERIRQIFYISLANFVFPLIFNIAQIICITTDRNPTTGVMLLTMNNYITVMGVLCATLWFSGTEWVRARNESLSDHMFNSPRPKFPRDHVAGGRSGSEVVVIRKESVTLDATGTDTGSDSNQFTTSEKENKYSLV